jgi:hypothetical protein
LVRGFQSLTSEYCNPTNYTTFAFRRQSQPAFPNPSYKATRAEKEMGQERAPKPKATPKAAEPRAKKAPKAAPRKEGRNPPAKAEQRLCFMSVLREYAIPLKSTNEVPAKCKDTCPRLHYADLPNGTPKRLLLAVAETAQFIADEHRSTLIGAFKSDKKLV